MHVQIEIYTKSFCSYCQRAKDLLRIKGVAFTEYDITADAEKAAEMHRRSAQRTVPGIFINNEPIGGCSELFALDEQGKLNPLLGLIISPAESFQ